MTPKNLAKEKGIYNKCYFAGRVQHEDVPKYLNSADILVAPFSRATGGMEFVINLKVIEYLSTGFFSLRSLVALRFLHLRDHPHQQSTASGKSIGF